MRAQRLARQMLTSSTAAGSPAEVVKGLCGLQAQDLPAARIGVWARTSGLTDAEVELTRTDDRTIVRTWAMRGTLHLLAAEDAGWIRGLYLPRWVKASARRSDQLGLDEGAYTKALDSLARILRHGRSVTRKELREELAGDGIDASGQRMPYLLARASYEGLICEGPLLSGKATYVLTSAWLGDRAGSPIDRDEALSRLARRYLAAYAPASAADFAVWSGLPATDARRTLEGLEEPPAIAGAEIPRVKLLPAFDTYLLGYKDRVLMVEDRYAKRVNAGGGIVKPVVLVDGRAAGTWALRRNEVVVEPFEPLPTDVKAEIDRLGDDLRRFLG